ncbi:MAG TPA: RNase adapter RapZ [Rhodospirillaceae bacterium]|nr:RNase adapter RapZ [Rhodospirillaceae bacterium]
MPDKPIKDKNQRPVIMLTGMSGAGLSTALKVLEDLGYEAVDNLRLGLVPQWVDGAKAGKALAVAIDARNANFSVEEVLRVLAQLQERDDCAPRLVFLDCSDEALQRRFTETRRRHPLAIDRPVTDGIAKERVLVARLQGEADHVIDTSALSIHDLRRLIVGHYRTETETGLAIYVMSFSYRYGLPREADLVFDARFLKNPHWDKTLRPLTGLEPSVGDYIEKDQDYEGFMTHITGLLFPLLPRYQQEGKLYLTIAVGCTGGRHRSVFIAEKLATALAGNGSIVGVGHRDIDKSPAKA